MTKAQDSGGLFDQFFLASNALNKAQNIELANELIKINDHFKIHFPKEKHIIIKQQDVHVFWEFLLNISKEELHQIPFLIKPGHSYSGLQLSNEIDKIILLKQIILLLAYAYKQFNSSHSQLAKALNFVLGLGRKIYVSKMIQNEDIVLLMKYAYILTLPNLNDKSDRHKITSNFNYRWLPLYSMIDQLIALSQETSMNQDANIVLQGVIDYLFDKVKDNPSLLTIINSSEKALDMLHIIRYPHIAESIKQRVITFLSRVYIGNYNEKILKALTSMIKDSLYHYNHLNETKEDVNVLIGQLDLIKEMIDCEKKMKDNDPYQCNMGFISKNNPSNGLSIKLNQAKGFHKTFAIVLSFQAFTLINDVDYPLMTFQSLDGKNEYLSISIRKNEIVLMAKTTFIGFYEFKSNVTYLVVIEWKKDSLMSKGPLNIMINKENVHSIDGKKNEVYIKLEEKFQVVVGTSTTNHQLNFIGKINPILLFSSNYIEVPLNTVFDLQGNYHEILNYCCDYDVKQCNQYVIWNVKEKAKQNKLLNDFYSFAHEHCILAITPMSIINQLKAKAKPKFHEVLYDLRKEGKDKELAYSFNEFPSIDNCCTYTYQYKLTSTEFLKHEGIAFLCLHIEFYYNLLYQKINKGVQQEIMKGLARVMKIVNYYFNNAHANFTFLKSSYDTVLFSLTKAISLLGDYNTYLFGDLEEEMVSLFNITLTILKKDENNLELKTIATKLFTFLIEPRFFDLSNCSLLRKLFKNFTTFLEDISDSENLITLEILDQLLKFHLVLSGPYLHERYFLINRISIHHISLSSHSEYKKMKQEYESLLGSFISKCNINLLVKLVLFIFDIPALVMKCKLLKIYYFSRNKDLKDMTEKKGLELTKKYKDYFDFYSSADANKPTTEPGDEKHKELIKAILLQLILESKEKEKSKEKIQLYDDINKIKTNIVQGAQGLINQKTNSSFNSQTNKSSNSSGTFIPDGKGGSEICPLIRLKGIVFNGQLSFYLLKSIFLFNYDSWDPKAKIFFISDNKSLINQDYLKVYASYNLCLDSFNKQKKNHLLFFINLLYRIEVHDFSTLDKTALLFCNYISQVYLAYTQSNQFIQPHLLCQFIHVFESKSIMGSFFTICFESVETTKYAKSVLQMITPDLVWKHPNPFIFKFTYSHMKNNSGEMFFVMKNVTVTFLDQLSRITNKDEFPHEKIINIVRFIIISHKLICSNLISKEVFESDNLSDSLIRLIILLKEKSYACFSNYLLLVSKKKSIRKSFHQILYELILKINEIINPKMGIEHIHEFSMIDKNTIFYHIDLRKKKGNAKMKKGKDKFNEAQFQLIETDFKNKFNSKEVETKTSDVVFYISLKQFIFKSNSILENFDSLIALLRMEIIEILTSVGIGLGQKEDDLYNEVSKKLNLFANSKSNTSATISDLFSYIDKKIEEFTSKEKFDLSNEENEKSTGTKTTERKDSFSNCDNKCNEGGIKKANTYINQAVISENILPLATFYDLDLDHPILCMKRDILLRSFGLYFQEVYFSNQNFLQLKRAFYASHSRKEPKSSFFGQKSKQTLPFPSKVKNYSSSKSFYPKQFLKQDLRYFRKANEFFSICHPSLDRKEYSSYKLFKIKHGLLNRKNMNMFSNETNEQVNSAYIFPCERISNETACFGYLYLHHNYILYQADPSFDGLKEYNSNKNFMFSSHDFDIEKKTKQIIMQISKINELLSRRFIFYYQAIELFLHNGKSYFFNLFTIKKQLEFFKSIEELDTNISIVRNPKDEFYTENFRDKWKTGQMSTYEYLLQINKYAGRSYNDLNQYPIFPWVINQIKAKPEKRQLKYPISVQNEAQRKRADDRFANPISPKFPCHFGIHFSNSAFVNTFLVRLLPFTVNQIKFQNGKFDYPDRQFHSFELMYYSLSKNLDNRELIPELFVVPEFAYNLNCIEFGQRHSDNHLVNNLKYSDILTSPLTLIILLKSTLNSYSIRDTIHQWIDNIFGVNQKKILKDCYIYPKQTYDSCVTPKLDAIQKTSDANPEKMIAYVRRKISSIIPIGQFPIMLFDNFHSNVIKKAGNNKDIEGFLEYARKQILYDNNPAYKDLVKAKIKYISKAKSSNLYFVLTKDKGKRCITIIDHQFNVKSHYVINRMSFLEKTQSKYSIYHAKCAIIEMNDCDMFISCRYYDNSIKVNVISKKIRYSAMTESFVSCLLLVDNNTLYSGHQNGKVMFWDIDYKETTFLSLRFEKSIIAHNDRVIAININTTNDVIITAGDDHKIFIRKIYDFELLSVINLDNNCIGVDIQISPAFDMIYVKVFDPESQLFNLALYTFNGLLFDETISAQWIDIFVTEKNKIIYIDSNCALSILSRDLKQKIKSIKTKQVASSVYYAEETKNVFLSYESGGVEKMPFIENKQ